MTGTTASLADVVGVVVDPPDGEGDAAGVEGLAAAEGAGVGLADGAVVGLGDAAAIVKVVVPWAMSPSSADAVVQRTV